MTGDALTTGGDQQIRSWRPSSLGRWLTRSPPWSVTLHQDELAVTLDGLTTAGPVVDFGEVQVTPGAVWSHVHVEYPNRRLRVRGIPNRRARHMAKTIAGTKASALRMRQMTADFDAAAQEVVSWAHDVAAAAIVQLEEHGWLTAEFGREWGQRQSSVGGGIQLGEPALQAHIAAQPVLVTNSIAAWQQDLTVFMRRENDNHLATQLAEHHDFFQTVEKSPLTDEQARAVVCFDNRMLVIAAAGSGKTSTMVAKAGYALRRNLVPADRILMLAFNNAAAKELKHRTKDRLTPLGLDADEVVANTFHAFGLHIIGQATGTKPTLAPWLGDGGDIAMLAHIVEELSRKNGSFRHHWGFFRAVLARDYADSDASAGPDGTPEEAGFRTCQGETVRSPGERLIADWLFFHGVPYLYEKRYEVDLTDAEHGHYTPDFYYPTIDAYHEHWATEADGSPMAAFEDYAESMAWKREMHRKHGTTLLETTTADLWSGKALRHLEAELTQRGIRLQPDPDRPVVGQKTIDNGPLLRTFRSFLIHAKSNRLTDEQLRDHLHSQPEGQLRYRDKAFLRLFTAIRREWENALSAQDCIDFEDMLTLATDHLEAGDWQSPYELVMVDEFQDASPARARLAHALVATPGRHLFAVGDDWQSINRFAGADLSVMTGFESWFGPSEILRLQRTFRFPQSLADASSQFVQQNPSQLPKTVVSTATEFPPTIGAVTVDTEEAMTAAIRRRLQVLHRLASSGGVPSGRGGKLSVLVLGRYNYQTKYVPEWRDLVDQLEVRFMTMHSSKGAEADYIVIPGLTTGNWGFPSTIADDPVLRLAMPAPEAFLRAEERRLFYVALTRARRGVLLVTVAKKESPFLMELIRDHGIVRTDAIGKTLESIVCPRCGRGFMVKRASRSGPFLGCMRFPWCKGTMSIKVPSDSAVVSDRTD